MKKYRLLTFLGTFLSCLIIAQSLEAKTSTSSSRGSQGDVEYNANDNSPTQPLVQTPPPQNSPNSVSVGVPSYYYYYYPQAYVAPVYGPGPNYNSGGNAGASFYNVNGTMNRGFYYNNAIPGQVPPPVNNNYFGPGYGGAPYYPYTPGGVVYR